MRTIEEKKLGGPYTKPEQEERRKQVHALYFEKGFSAVKIATELGVNRNTINEDIRYWLSHIGSQMPNGSIASIVFKQIEILESQRQRLLEQVEKETEFDSKIKIEKMILEITYKIASLVAKMSATNNMIDDYGLNIVSYETLADASQNEAMGITKNEIARNQNTPESWIKEQTVPLSA
jgi:transposase-like protein